MSILDPKEKYKHLAKVKENIFKCISCGDCREATDITSGKWGVCVAKDHSPGFEPFFGRGKMQIIRSIWQGRLELSKELAYIIYQCPTCNACSKTCAYDFNNVLIYEALRAELVESGYGLEAHEIMNQAMIDSLNPYGRDNKQKNEWIQKIEFKIKNAKSEEAEVLYFAGCTAALTPSIQSVAINTVQLLKKIDVNLAVFGENEVCCGSVAMRTGDLQAFEFVKKKNIEQFKKAGIKKIITSCAGCYRTLKIDYADNLKELNIEVFHTIEFILKEIKENNIPLKNLGLNVTYHDPCHTGRHTGLYNEPRALLNQISNLTEMKTIKENAKCCGAGGGVKKAFPELSLEIAKTRVNEAEETGADYLVSICPFCYRNLSDAIKALNSNIKMVDLIELINQAIDWVDV
ncbi:MAG: (Fe-S)-binding protein [Candidatus Helarchaeota archaeon]